MKLNILLRLDCHVMGSCGKQLWYKQHWKNTQWQTFWGFLWTIVMVYLQSPSHVHPWFLQCAEAPAITVKTADSVLSHTDPFPETSQHKLINTNKSWDNKWCILWNAMHMITQYYNGDMKWEVVSPVQCNFADSMSSKPPDLLVQAGVFLLKHHLTLLLSVDSCTPWQGQHYAILGHKSVYNRPHVGIEQFWQVTRSTTLKELPYCMDDSPWEGGGYFQCLL
jgi:hypothetical protein